MCYILDSYMGMESGKYITSKYVNRDKFLAYSGQDSDVILEVL